MQLITNKINFKFLFQAMLSCTVFSPTYHDLAWGSPKEIYVRNNSDYVVFSCIFLIIRRFILFIYSPTFHRLMY